MALAVGLISAGYVFARARAAPAFGSDFDQIWFAARMVLADRNPYDLIGPGRFGDWQWPFYYPLPAAIIALPFAGLSVLGARVAFSGCAGALLAFALTRRGEWTPLIALASGSYLSALMFVQWSPLLAAAVAWPALGFVVAGKPNVGLAMLAGFESRRAIAIALIGAASISLASLLAQPDWILDWLSAMRDAPHIRAFVSRPLGWVMLLALLRWRRPEARMLVALALVPHNPPVHEALILFAVPQSRASLIALAMLTHLVDPFVGPVERYANFSGYADGTARAMLLFVYVPYLMMILGRPNEGHLPVWLERAAGRLPSWLRGHRTRLVQANRDMPTAAGVDEG